MTTVPMTDERAIIRVRHGIAANNTTEGHRYAAENAAALAHITARLGSAGGADHVVAEGDTYTPPAHGWTCFHCGDHFAPTPKGQKLAVEHFGSQITHKPACTIDVAEYRRMETLVERALDGDTDVDRMIIAERNVGRERALRAEEIGYARGLKDSGNCPCSAPPASPARALESWETVSMTILADALEKRGDDLSTDSASWLRKFMAEPLARAAEPDARPLFSERTLRSKIEGATFASPVDRGIALDLLNHMLAKLAARAPVPAVDDAMVRRFYDEVNPLMYSLPPPNVIRAALTAALAQNAGEVK